MLLKIRQHDRCQLSILHSLLLIIKMSIQMFTRKWNWKVKRWLLMCCHIKKRKHDFVLPPNGCWSLGQDSRNKSRTLNNWYKLSYGSISLHSGILLVSCWVTWHLSALQDKLKVTIFWKINTFHISVTLSLLKSYLSLKMSFKKRYVNDGDILTLQRVEPMKMWVWITEIVAST